VHINFSLHFRSLSFKFLELIYLETFLYFLQNLRDMLIVFCQEKQTARFFLSLCMYVLMEMCRPPELYVLYIIGVK